VFRYGRGHLQAQGRVSSDVPLLFKFTLPPPTLEGKLEWFFAHLALGQIIRDSGSTLA
jgi:hypothetical protein